jgi:FKBP-type peptidyl-prolyl cis-trans isomerase FklB
MKLSAAAAAIAGVMLLSGLSYGAEESKFTTQKERISYAIGVQMGNNMKKQGVELDPDIMSRGLKDAFSGGKLLMTEEEMAEAKAAFEKEIADKLREVLKQVAEKNKKEGEAFLRENKKKEGVVALPDGLQYRIIKKGKGPTPKIADTVTANYKGTRVDGTEFDSTYKRGKPVTFPVNGVIKGWTEALQLMKVGSKWQLFIPPELAYGEHAAGPLIGPYSTLVFEMELLSINRKAAPKGGQGADQKK